MNIAYLTYYAVFSHFQIPTKRRPNHYVVHSTAYYIHSYLGTLLCTKLEMGWCRYEAEQVDLPNFQRTSQNLAKYVEIHIFVPRYLIIYVLVRFVAVSAAFSTTISRGKKHDCIVFLNFRGGWWSDTSTFSLLVL